MSNTSKDIIYHIAIRVYDKVYIADSVKIHSRINNVKMANSTFSSIVQNLNGFICLIEFSSKIKENTDTDVLIEEDVMVCGRGDLLPFTNFLDKVTSTYGMCTPVLMSNIDTSSSIPLDMFTHQLLEYAIANGEI